MTDTDTSATPAGEEAVLPAERAPGEHAHPSERQYVMVAIILAVVTAVEVGLYYIELSKPLLVTCLLVLAVVKFAMVALWFMHLRFDSRLFRQLFMAGLLLAIAVYTIVLLTFGVFISDQGSPGQRPPAAGGNP